MVRHGISEECPTIVFGLSNQFTFRRIVPYIDEICPDFFVGILWGATERSIKKGTFSVADLIVLKNKKAGVIPHKCCQLRRGCRLNGEVSVVWHRAHSQNTHFSLSGRGADNGKPYQVIQITVEDYTTICGALIAVIQDVFLK